MYQLKIDNGFSFSEGTSLASAPGYAGLTKYVTRSSPRIRNKLLIATSINVVGCPHSSNIYFCTPDWTKIARAGCKPPTSPRLSGILSDGHVINLEVEWGDEVVGRARSDGYGAAIHQLAMNLLANARVPTPAGIWLEVRVK